MQSITINDGQRVRHIGDFYEDTNTFYKEVDVTKHLFKKFDAWGIDARYLADVLLVKDAKIVIFDKASMVAYSTTAKEFKKNGRYFHFKDQADHGTQVFLSRKHFNQKVISNIQ